MVLNNGTLNINAAAALGTTAGTFVINGGTLDNTSGAAITTSNYLQTWNNGFAFTGAADGTHNLNLGTNAVSLGTAAGTSRSLTINAGTLAVGGSISGGTTANSLVKAGDGALTLSGSSSFTGGVTLNAGTLNMNHTNALGTSAGTFVINGGSLDNTSGALISSGVNYKMTWGGDFTFLGGSGTTHDIFIGSGLVSLGANAGAARTITVNGGIFRVGGIISNGTHGTTPTTALVKAGAGTLYLGGANTFSGGVTLNAGFLNAGNVAALGSTGSSFTINGGSIYGTNITLNSYAHTWAGDFGYGYPGILADGSLNLGIGPVTLSGTGSTRTITTEGIYGTLTVGGVISDGATVKGITKNGSGILVLGAANTFTGGVVLNAGTLTLLNAGALGSGGLTINGGTLNATAALTVASAPQTWNGDFTYLGNNNLTISAGTITASGSRTVTVVANSLTLGGAIVDGATSASMTFASGIIGGAGANINLTGNSTYTGTTLVQGPNGVGNVKLLTGTLAGTSGVTVNGGGNFWVGTTGTGVSNRINPAATLTLGGAGGGIFELFGSQNATVNSQSFASLTVGAGANSIFTDQNTNISQVTFTGANPYLRSVGGVVRIAGVAGSFTNVPSGTGNVIGTGASAMLIGATYRVGGTVVSDANTFVKAAAGTVAAPTVTGSWGTGLNTDVAAGNVTASGAVSQSLRFNGGATLTLPGAFTVESGGILGSGNPSSPVTITGGSLRTGLAGGDLWVVQGGTAGANVGIIIGSQIIDNGASSLTKVGPRALYLTNTNNTYAGGTFHGEGVLTIASEGSLGTGALNFTGSSTLQAGGNVALGSRAVTIAPGLSATIDTNGNNVSVGGVISGAQSGLTKAGVGMLTLSAENTYTGATSLTNGTLKLDFSAAGAPLANILHASSPFNPGGYYQGFGNLQSVATTATLTIQGKDNTANSQTFSGISPIIGYGSMTVGQGITRLNLAAGTDGSLAVNLGSISKGGGGVTTNTGLDIAIGAGVTVTTSNFLGNGLINPQFNTVGNGGAWVTVNGSTWATLAGNTIVGLANAAYATSLAVNASQTDVRTSGAITTAGVNPYTLRFNDTNTTGADITLTLRPTTTTSVSGGAVLVTSNVGAHNSTITGGFLLGYARRDVAVFQNNPLGDLIISSQVTDTNGAEAISKYGAGRLLLTATNTNTGSLFVNEGTVVATGDYTPGIVKTVTTTTGSNVVPVADTTGLFIGQPLYGTGVQATNTPANVIAAINPNTSVTLTTNITTGGTITGTFQSGGALGGSINIPNVGNGGGSITEYIGTSGTLEIGNGGTHGSLDPNCIVNNLGTFVLNRSDTYTFGNSLTGNLVANNLAGAVGTNTFEVKGGGTVTLGAAGVVAGTATSGQKIYVLAAVGNVYAGQVVTGTGIAGGTTVTGVDGLNVTFNNNTTAAVSNATFTTNNTFTGSTKVSNGSTLLLGSPTAIAAASPVVINGATLDVGALSATSTSTSLTLNDGNITGTGTLNLNGGTLVATGGTISAKIGGTGSASLGSLVKNGSGTLTLSAANTYTGATFINAGTLALGASASIATSSRVTIAAGAKLDTTAKPSYTLPTALTLGVDATTGTSGQIDATGQELVISSAVVTLNVTGSLTAPAYVLATYGSKTGAAFSSVVGLPAGYLVNYTYNGGTQIALVQSDPFLTWIGSPAFGLAAGDKGTAADPDHDGLSNVTEFALDGNPASGAANRKVITKIASVGGSPTLVLTLPVRVPTTFSAPGAPTNSELVSAPVDNLVYQIQGGDNLAGWTHAVSEVTGADKTAIEATMPALSSAGWTYRTFSSPLPVAAAPKEFLRAVIVTQP